MIQWLPADNEAARELGVRFLCQHGEHLGVPYNWSTVMSSLACSIEDNGFIIGIDSSGQIIGVLAYTIGAGEDDYEDQTRIEVHLLYIKERPLRGRILLAAMHKLARQILDSPNAFREVVFYAAPSSDNRKLFAKFAALESTTEHPCGLLDFYTATPKSLLEYADCNRE
ncbi:hypothetical protein [Paenibacillus eucommiae]|uniref:N-acetyltransferase domain-containing protein n=1 Tax=Paenibacillus eucommiae TaxID=1355755 RepID=A0ABS4IWJ4_9BACL|nr:hypothetical protein [Paenibacillus eucommiae]MBP1991935.1 hypothetical protein [Paenibacillus eucommiae]